MSGKRAKRKRSAKHYRIAGCGHCFKYIRVPDEWTSYLCPHCGRRLEGRAPAIGIVGLNPLRVPVARNTS